MDICILSAEYELIGTVTDKYDEVIDNVGGAYWQVFEDEPYFVDSDVYYIEDKGSVTKDILSNTPFEAIETR